jgi:hypothetical protein
MDGHRSKFSWEGRYHFDGVGSYVDLFNSLGESGKGREAVVGDVKFFEGLWEDGKSHQVVVGTSENFETNRQRGKFLEKVIREV